MWKWSLTVEMTLSTRIAVIAASLLVVGIGLLELDHLVRFGHFSPFGLHADVVMRRRDYGIDGITKTYEAKLTNYGFTPRTITACDFIDDTLSHGTEVGYTVEKWNASTSKWENIFKIETSAFCVPYPLGIVKGHVVTKRLWPGQSISAGEEATAARDIFAIGDRARFVVLADKGFAIPTAEFAIDEHRKIPDVPYSVRH
jgi:hypothetical protein